MCYIPLDDVLSYIGPTLEKHMHCDILDLNPGIGLWSSKIHEFIQPRSHILLEPHAAMYHKQLEPLLKEEGSTYRLVEEDPYAYKSYEKLVNEGYFPHQKRLDQDDPRILEPNNTLLITGSLNYYPRMPGKGDITMCGQVLKKLVSDAWDQNLIHVYGKVRMLVWIQKSDRYPFVAECITQKRTNNILTNKLFHIREVVQCPLGPKSPGVKERDIRYQLQNATKVIHSMRKAGFELPSHRQSVLHKLGNEALEKGVKNGDLGIDGSMELLEDAERRGLDTQGHLREDHRDFILGEQILANNPSVARVPITPEEMAAKVKKNYRSDGRPLWKPPMSDWGRCHGYNSAHANIHKKDRVTRQEGVEKSMEIYRLECQLVEVKDDKKARKIRQQLDNLVAQHQEGIENTIPSIRYRITSDEDDHYAINAPVPLLERDERLYDVMQAQEDEFWPPSPTSLLDLEPRMLPRSATPKDHCRAYSRFLTNLMERAKLPVAHGLENLQNGASELLEAIPELRNPAKGGRPDLSRLRVRLMSTEMFDAIYKAYMNWPFRAIQYYLPHHVPSPKKKLGRPKGRKVKI